MFTTQFKKSRWFRILSAVLVLTCSLTLGPGQAAFAQLAYLPLPGAMVTPTNAFVPVMMKGMVVHPDNPLLFDFIIDSGHSGYKIDGPQFKAEAQKLIKYFLASLTIKEDDLWVNLSPYEKDRMIPKDLGKTEMGRDMLAQDYVLKQLTASLLYPEKELGKKFWDSVYAKVQKQYGNVDIPVDTFNKVWIVADHAKVLERNNAAFVIGWRMKVMMEEDYVAAGKSGNKQLAVGSGTKAPGATLSADHSRTQAAHALAAQAVKEIIIPEIEKEVNQGKNFTQLRQMFHAMILASWYKKSLKNSLINQVYSNQGKTGGVETADQTEKDKIYNRYLQAFKQGVFNYIKEDTDPISDETTSRKYFSGGFQPSPIPEIVSSPANLGERAALIPQGRIALVANAVSGAVSSPVSNSSEEREIEAVIAKTNIMIEANDWQALASLITGRFYGSRREILYAVCHTVMQSIKTDAFLASKPFSSMPIEIQTYLAANLGLAAPGSRYVELADFINKADALGVNALLVDSLFPFVTRQGPVTVAEEMQRLQTQRVFINKGDLLEYNGREMSVKYAERMVRYILKQRNLLIEDTAGSPAGKTASVQSGRPAASQIKEKAGSAGSSPIVIKNQGKVNKVFGLIGDSSAGVYLTINTPGVNKTDVTLYRTGTGNLEIHYGRPGELGVVSHDTIIGQAGKYVEIPLRNGMGKIFWNVLEKRYVIDLNQDSQIDQRAVLEYQENYRVILNVPGRNRTEFVESESIRKAAMAGHSLAQMVSFEDGLNVTHQFPVELKLMGNKIVVSFWSDAPNNQALSVSQMPNVDYNAVLSDTIQNVYPEAKKQIDEFVDKTLSALQYPEQAKLDLDISIEPQGEQIVATFRLRDSGTQQMFPGDMYVFHISMGNRLLTYESGWSMITEFSDGSFQLAKGISAFKAVSAPTRKDAAASPALTPGGLDLNGNKMGLDVVKEGKGIEFKASSAIAEQLRSGNFTGLQGIILQIIPI
ncbi:MAG: hypothetical protein HQL23_05855, partial [Candidatus Omnitrophica bacterium]|nr:hypothetical protein [Candidatus Omnitrophota bacterium]